MKLLQKKGTSGKNVPLLLLLAVGIIEFFFITQESRFSGIGYYLAETYLIVPCLLLLGYVLREKLSAFAKRRLLLAVAAVSWFVISQCLHKLSGMENHPMATVFFVYLMAFPFAALADDRDSSGLRLIGGMFVAASLVLVYYTVLLLLDRVPASLTGNIFWDGARLNAMWHPNLGAFFFMIGIGFSAVFCVQTQKLWVKMLLLAAIVVQFLAMALTNCRTTLLLTGAFLGGTLFFLILRGNWKQLIPGLLVAAVVLVGSFKLSGWLYQWNNDRLIAAMAASQAEAIPEETAPAEEILPTETVQAEAMPTEETIVQTTPVPEETAEEVLAPETAVEETAVQEAAETEAPVPETQAEEIVVIENTGIILGDNEQHSLATDMRSLNGRTQIWEAALRAVRSNKAMALWGTEYVGTAISAYHWFPVVHAHNSWMEALMRMGLPGLMLSLVFTVLSVWSAVKLIFRTDIEIWKKIIVMMTMCVLAAGFLEPYLFITNVYYHIMDFVFFFCTGYLDFWCSHKQDTKA